MTNQISKYNSSLFFILFLLLPISSQADDTIEELKNCARTEDKSTRVECYEALGKKVLQADGNSSSALPDSLGGGDFAKKAGVKEQTSRGLVTSCRKAVDGRWFYIFDNGQVWKQVDTKRRFHKECKFNVTISKASFGYVMQIDGENRKTRIARRK